jgi:GTP-binding protein
VLLYVVDASGTSGRDPAADLRAVRDEVGQWDGELLERPQLVVASKRDAVADPDPLPALREAARKLGLDVLPISAVTQTGLGELKQRLAALVAPAVAVGEEER